MQKHHSPQSGQNDLPPLSAAHTQTRTTAPCHAMCPAEQRAGVRGAAAGGEAGTLEPGTRPRVSAATSHQPPASSLQFVPDTAPGLASTVMRPVVAACLVYSNVAAAGVETACSQSVLMRPLCPLYLYLYLLLRSAPHRRLHSWCEVSPQPGRCCCTQDTPS